MSIFRRNKIWYASLIIPGGKRIKESLKTSDKRLATELHDRRKAELWRIEKLGDFPDVTFDDACMRWLQEKADKKSLRTDEIRMSFWLAHLEGVKLRDITEQYIYAAVNKMVNRSSIDRWRQKSIAAIKNGNPVDDYIPVPASASTKSRQLSLIKSILRTAEREWKWIEKAPAIKIPSVRNRRIRWLEPSDAKRLINECPEPLKSVVQFALATGLRRSNIINLEWSQIDMQRKVAWINPEDTKSGKAIGVALNDTACRVLRRQVGKHESWVFVHTKAAKKKDGTPTNKVRKMRVDDNTAFHAACERAGIIEFRFHDLRHTWASWLIQSGVPISVLQEMGGWESVEMVRRYAHLAPSHLTEHAQQIDAIFGTFVPKMSHYDMLKKAEKV